MKKVIAVLLTLGLILTLSACGNSATEETITIKFSHDMAEGSPQDIGAKEFKRLVEENSNGSMKVEIYANSLLGVGSEIADQVQINAIQAAIVPTAKLSGYAPQVQLFDLPFLFPSKEIAYGVFDSEITGKIFEGLDKKAIETVTVWESGFKQFTNNYSISEPSDFEGLKIRIMDSPLLAAQYEAVGGVPSVIAFTETYNALQQGTVDGQENPLVSIVSMKFYEVQDYLTISNHGYLGYAFMLSDIFMESLTSEQQEIVRQAAFDAAKVERQAITDMEVGFINTIKEDGSTTIIELTNEQREAFQSAMLPVHEQFRDSIGSDLLDAVYDKIVELQA